MSKISRFMIGQYGSFDEDKYVRDFQPGFYGIEACLFNQEGDIDRLFEESRKGSFQVGVHFPLRAGMSKLRDALVLSSDEDTRLQAYDLIQRELDFLSPLAPSYVLFHYPKPVILDDRVDWSQWRFNDRSEYEYESLYPIHEFQEKSDVFLEWLSNTGKEYGFTPVLEFDALNAYVYANDYLTRSLEKHDNIRLCLDTARLYIQDRIDPRLDSRSVIAQYAKFAATVHLSNVRITDDNRIVQSRYPVLPTHNPNDGWAPIEEYLRIIARENNAVKIMFEHRSDLVSDEELLECYRWVDRVLKKGRP